MSRLVNTLGDRLLGLVVPQQQASACAGPECWYEYTCGCRRRQCCVTWQNKLCCGSYSGLCCE